MSNYIELLQHYGIRPKKSKGQNFLIDDAIVNTIITASGISKKDHILEIGPGLGVLTEQLIAHAGNVLSVELDDRLAVIVADRFKDRQNFECMQADILAVRNDEIRELLHGDYRVIANIPYVITSAIIRKFLSYEPRPTDLFLMVQKEVAERIVAQPGEMSVLAVSVQYYAQAELVTVVPRSAFYPAPEVDSALLRIVVDPVARAGVTDKKFFSLVKIGFSARRKKLYNNLAAGFRMDVADVKDILTKAGLSVDCRAQDLSVDDWLTLYRYFSE